MTVTRTNRNQRFDRDGNLISEEVVEVDVTEKVNERSLDDRLVQAVDLLGTVRTRMRTVIDGDASNINQVNQALDLIADAVDDVARIQTALVRKVGRMLDDIEDTA